MDAAVTVLAGGAGDDALAGVLGAARARAVRDLMVRRARDWAVTAFGEAAVSVLDAGEAGIAAVLDGADPGRPLVVVLPALAAWRGEIAVDVVDDLRHGCAASVGPVDAGGFYLFGLAEPRSELARALGTREAHDRDALMTLAAGVQRERSQIGLLRSERGLRSETDVRATLADPLCDPELRGLLE